MTTQISIPTKISFDELRRKKSLGSALEMCADVSGYQFDSMLAKKLVVDKGQFSRWQSGEEGIKWEKFTRLMDTCGNDAPLLWMLHDRGYELESVRRLQSQTEKALCQAHAELEAERLKVLVLTNALNGRTA